MSLSVEKEISRGAAWRRRSPLKFFLLVFGLTIPFWVIGAVTGLELLPGLPVAALAAFCPMIAAVMLVYQENRTAGVIALLKRAFDVQRVHAKIWYVPTLLLMPGVMILSYGALRLMGTPVPAPHLAVLSVLALFIAFFLSALGEELGWSGYMTDPMQQRWGALQASIVLGVVWAIWHFVALVQAHRSVEWIAWWSLGTVAARVIIVWLYNNTGRSVFVAALFHMMIDVTWQLFPIHGSFYDPRVTSLIMAGVAAIVVVVWGPRTLARS
jgi:uncharacterized protein